jgi:dephospho-CoA kinase
MAYCVGLTGGIGSGKSTAAEMFAEFGVAVVDTDEISRVLTAAGGAAMPAIRKEFGAEYVAADGSLDRKRMREFVFRDPAAKGRLEALLHPMIRERARKSVAEANNPYVILAVPLLLETGAYSGLVRRVLVVDCSEARQVERATRRSALSAEEVRAIMASQMPREARRARADDVLDNDGDARYLALARGA